MSSGDGGWGGRNGGDGDWGGRSSGDGAGGDRAGGDRAGGDGAGAPRLTRRAAGLRRAAPVRIVHLGIGNFARAHQAWYTDHAPDADGWGIAAFTGRSATLADALQPQDGAYTLVTRGPDRDAFETITSLSAVHPASDLASWRRYLTDPRVAVVTCTVTEAGYHLTAGRALDLDDPAVAADVGALRADPSAAVTTAPARLAAGLYARHLARAGRIAVVPCDNLPGNGSAVAAAVSGVAAAVGARWSAAVTATAQYVATVVDRITPATTDADLAVVLAETGLRDAAPVVTEPFSEWILAGEFPAGRPDWEAAGARFAADAQQFEHRKLWLLNGSHSLLAYAGSIRGHTTIAEAIADPVCTDRVRAWWAEAGPHLALPPADVAAYCSALLRRYRNPRIRHLLSQIAEDGSQKVPIRILPVLRAERAAGRMPRGACTVLAAWICHLRGAGAPVTDAAADRFRTLAAGPLPAATQRVLAAWDDALARDATLVDRISADAAALLAQRPPPTAAPR